MNVELSDADMAEAVAYLDGVMNEERRLAYELRLAADPALAQAVERLFETDELLRRVHDTQQVPLRRSPARRPILWFAAAAAVAAILFVARSRFATRESASSFALAVAPSWESATEFNAEFDELRALRPPGLSERRGEVSAPNVSASEFAQRAAEVEHAIAQRALEQPAEAVAAGYFVVIAKTNAPGSAIVIALSSNLPAQRIWPTNVTAQEPGRLTAGTHTLPAPRIALATDESGRERVTYHRGFLVPIGANELTVFFAWREQSLDPSTLNAIDATLQLDRAAIERELHQLGFTLAERSVREP